MLKLGVGKVCFFKAAFLIWFLFPAISMRSFFIWMGFVLIPMFSVKGQVPDTVYLNQHSLITSKRADAILYYFRTYTDASKTAGRTEVFYMNGVKESVENFMVERRNETEFFIKEGPYSAYYENGQQRHLVNYKNGKAEGQSTYWLPNGRVLRMVNYRNGRENGEAYTFYQNRKIKRKEVFENGVLLEGKCYTKSGADTVFYAFEEKPVFIGGEAGLDKFLKDNLRYPKSAVQNRVTGLVVVQFTVTHTGDIVGSHVVKEMDSVLNEEALRVVGLMLGKFKPGRLDGIPVSQGYILPFRFTIN